MLQVHRCLYELRAEGNVADQIYIKSFQVENIDNVKPITVGLGDTKKHLIITGRNGSGKTSILRAIQAEIVLIKNSRGRIQEFRELRIEAEKQRDQNPARKYSALEANPQWPDAQILLNTSGGSGFVQEDEICILFSATRSLQANNPASITPPSLPVSRANEPDLNRLILQHLVNLKAQRAFAKEDEDENSVSAIDKWFESFSGALREAFESPAINLEFDRKALDFKIVEGDKKYSFNALSSGQSAILSIYAELLLRVEAAAQGNSDISGVILIDEPENHLHASLQKKILLLLVQAFPQFQFIVSTHSPFVISSLQNAKILNLEDGKLYEDFSSFSYEAILEEYMQVDKYSIDVKKQVEEIKEFMSNGNSDDAKERLQYLLTKLNNSGFSIGLSAELALELNSIKLALKNLE